MVMECRLYLEDAPAEVVGAPDAHADLGSNWEALNFLFTGRRDSDGTPASLLVEEWDEIAGGQEAIIDPDAVAVFRRWLAGQADDVLLSRFDPQAMEAAGVYRARTLKAYPAECLEELRQGLASLRTFIERASEVGGPVVRVII
jgi:hypothetical protein